MKKSLNHKSGLSKIISNKKKRPLNPQSIKAPDIYRLRRYCQSYSRGHNKELIYQLACAYAVFLDMLIDRMAYQKLLDDEMFADIHQPPRNEEVAVWVVLFTFCATAGTKRGRVRRYAPILNRYRTEGVDPGDVEHLLVDEGGITGAYNLSTAGNAKAKAGGQGQQDQDQDEDQQDDEKNLPAHLSQDEEDQNAHGGVGSSSNRRQPKASTGGVREAGAKTSTMSKNAVQLELDSRRREARQALQLGPATFFVMVEAKPKPDDPHWKEIRLLRVKHRRTR